MNVSQAAALVRESMHITYQSCTREDGYTHVRIEATISGQPYWAVGNSKYRLNDANEGLPWNPTLGINKAVGKAVSKVAHRIVEDAKKREEEVTEMLTASGQP